MEKSLSFSEFLKLQKPEWKWSLMGFIGCIGDGLRYTAIGFATGQLIPVCTMGTAEIPAVLNFLESLARGYYSAVV